MQRVFLENANLRFGHWCCICSLLMLERKSFQPAEYIRVRPRLEITEFKVLFCPIIWTQKWCYVILSISPKSIGLERQPFKPFYKPVTLKIAQRIHWSYYWTTGNLPLFLSHPNILVKPVEFMVDLLGKISTFMKTDFWDRFTLTAWLCGLALMVTFVNHHRRPPFTSIGKNE